ncbi:MAG: cupin domain-containing protein [Cumulibacter sp.]
MAESASNMQVLGQANLDEEFGPSNVLTVTIELDPGSAGSPPHRHSGPVFGYLIEGELVFEIEGEPERVIRAGEAFWERGGDVIHYQAANNLTDARTVFLAVLVCAPDQEILTYVSADELAQRSHLRHPRT